MLPFIISQLPALGMGFWLIYVLWRKKSWYQLTLAVLIYVFVTFHSISAACYVNYQTYPFGVARTILHVTSPCVLPLMYFYMLSALGLRRTHLVTALLLVFPILLSLFGEQWFPYWSMMEMVIVVESLWFVARTYHDYRNYGKRMSLSYNQRHIILILLFIAVSSLLRNGVGNKFWMENREYALLDFCYNCAFYFRGLYLMYACAMERSEKEGEDVISKGSYLPIPTIEPDVEPTRMEQLQMSLKRIMEEDKIYLRTGLRMDDLAMELGTNRTYVARLMMETYGRSFVEQVNISRIKSAQDDMLRHRNSTMEEIALRNGFASGSSFNRVFRHHVGTTPIAWRNQALEYFGNR